MRRTRWSGTSRALSLRQFPKPRGRRSPTSGSRLRCSCRTMPATIARTRTGATEPSAALVRATTLAAQLDTVAGLDAARRRGRGGSNPPPNFVGVNGALAGQLNAQDLGDMAPTRGAVAAFTATCKELATVAAAWQRLSTTELGAVNILLREKGRRIIPLPTCTLAVPTCTT